MSDKYTFLDWLSLVLVIVGAVNWGLVGFFDWNLVDAIFGIGSIAARVIYALVGLGGLYMIATGVKMGQQQERHTYTRAPRERMV